jgi:predicted nucleic acid-binding Zn ribbon protein
MLSTSAGKKSLDGSINEYKKIEKKWKKSEQEVEEMLSTDEELFDFKKLSMSQKKQLKTIGLFTFRGGGSGTPQPIYSFENINTSTNHPHKGFYVIPNAIDQKDQLEIAYKCLYVIHLRTRARLYTVVLLLIISILLLIYVHMYIGQNMWKHLM